MNHEAPKARPGSREACHKRAGRTPAHLEPEVYIY
jgi:hypothetical protein